MTDLLLKDSHVPIQFRETLFDDFDTGRRRKGARVLRQIEDWEPTDAKPGLLLQGPPDAGKTMLSSAILNEYHAGLRPTKKTVEQARKILLQKQCPVYFIQLAELISWHLRRFNLRADVERGIREPSEYLDLDRLLEDLKDRVKVLVIDDVGKEHRTGSGFAVDEFDLLVRTRHNNGLTTIYTTNYPVQSWSRIYSDSMRSIVERSSLVLDF